MDYITAHLSIVTYAIVKIWLDTDMKDRTFFKFTKYKNWSNYLGGDVKFPFIRDLLSCPYCVGFWINLFVIVFFNDYKLIGNFLFNLFLSYGIFLIIWVNSEEK